MSVTIRAPHVPTRRVLRRLGVPDDVRPPTAWLDLAEEAAEWYATFGRPWRTSEKLAVVRIERDRVHLDSAATLESAVLARGFATADVFAILLIAVSAGAEVDAEVRRLYAVQRPDAAQFLGAYAAGITELLREEELMGHRQLLPPYAPGYRGWQLRDQAVLYDALRDRGPLLFGASSCLTPLCSSIAIAGKARRACRSEHAGFWATHGGHSCKGGCLPCNCSKN